VLPYDAQETYGYKKGLRIPKDLTDAAVIYIKKCRETHIIGGISSTDTHTATYSGLLIPTKKNI
jgi:hypothetical protein